jgi:streptogramin lyase
MWVAAPVLLIACDHRPLPLASQDMTDAGTDAGPLCGRVLCAVTERCEGGACQSRITEFSLPPDPVHSPIAWDVTSGPDGNLWFTELRGAIGRITPDGRVTEFPVAPPPGAASAGAWDIAAGPDGDLWFIESDDQADWIARMTPAGAVDHFALPAGHYASAIAVGPAGDPWFVERAGRIGHVTAGGALSEIDLPGRAPLGITAGADGALWLTDDVGASFVDRFDPGAAGGGGTDGGPALVEFPLSSAAAESIVAAPDGGLWICETVFVAGPREGGAAPDAGGIHSAGGKMAHRDAAGAVREFPTDTGSDGPADVTIGPDGNAWFTDFENSRIGRITPDGVITEFPLPHAPVYPRRITTGADGNIWFTEDQAIGRMVPP